MSSYRKQTVHPETRAVENAEWLDDYFGQHNYGVRFPSDGKVFRADQFDWSDNPTTMCFEGVPRVAVLTIDHTEKGSRFDHPLNEVEEHADGKRTITTKHEDGRQDVRVEVTRLNLEHRTPEDDKAEAAIIDAMSKKVVQVVVLHKPSMQNARFDSPLPEVRKRALAVIEVFNKPLTDERKAPLSEFVVLQSDSDITVSTL